MKVLLTGGSGFLGRHCLDQLLKRGHSVVFTVRSQAKGDRILADSGSSAAVSYSIVDDITRSGAFDESLKAHNPFDAVLHTASPFHYNPVDAKKDMIDPAVNGTLEILRAVKAHAPSVKSIVVTSSFAAIINMFSTTKWQYSGDDWNPITMEQAFSNGMATYVGSKTFAERAAWDFVAVEKPSFTLATINPVMIFGPVLGLDRLADINTSNATICDMIQGKMKSEIKANSFQWVDVRDVALAHVLAAETKGAARHRFIVAAGSYSNHQVAKIIKDKFPELADKFPDNIEVPSSPGGLALDTTPAKDILGVQFRALEDAVVATVQSLLNVGK